MSAAPILSSYRPAGTGCVLRLGKARLQFGVTPMSFSTRPFLDSSLISLTMPFERSVALFTEVLRPVYVGDRIRLVSLCLKAGKSLGYADAILTNQHGLEVRRTAKGLVKG